MEQPKFGEIIGAVLSVVALGVISYVVIVIGNDQALGGLISLLAAAVGYYLRGRVETPPTENPLLARR